MPFRGFDRLIGFRGQADWPPNPIQHAVETTMVIEVASQTRKTEQKPQSAQVQDAQASLCMPRDAGRFMPPGPRYFLGCEKLSRGLPAPELFGDIPRRTPMRSNRQIPGCNARRLAASSGPASDPYRSRSSSEPLSRLRRTKQISAL
jgi:hypothetical protein